MKATPTLLALSFAANLGLLLWAQTPGFRSSIPPAPLLPPKPFPEHRSEQQPNAMSLEAFTEALKADNSEFVADFLKQLGLDEQTRRKLVRAFVEDKFRRRAEAEFPTPTRDELPYWKRHWHKMSEQERLCWDKRREIEKLETQEMERLGLNDKAVHKRFSYLSDEKNGQLMEIETAYDKFRSEVFEKIDGFWMQSDDDRLRILNEEEHREIQAALSPEEKETMELRNDSSAHQVARNFGDVLSSEEEFKALYRLTKEQEVRAQEIRKSPQGMHERLAQLELEMEARTRALLGPDRAAQVEMEHDADRTLAQSAVKRLGLPEGTVNQLMNLRDQLSVQSRLIAENTGMPRQDREAALKALQAQSSLQLTTLLGKEGASTYLSRANWARILSDGRAFTRNLTGYRSLPPGP